jgi:endoglucanase
MKAGCFRNFRKRAIHGFAPTHPWMSAPPGPERSGTGRWSLIRLLAGIAAIAFANPAWAITPVAANGKLRVQGTFLVNETGEPVQLRGVATHGLQWFGRFYGNGASFEAAADQWGADIIRLTLYLSEDGYLTSKKITQAEFEAMIDAYVKICVQKGIYVILDWHVHKPGYPAYYQEQAKAFFAKMSAKYGALPNLLWEICNEPSEASLTEVQSGQAGVTDPGHYATWDEIAAYAKVIIPILKAENPDAVILVGTPSWSTLGVSTRGNDAWKEIAAKKLGFSNVLYVIHYYAASHGFQSALEAASQELPLFSTEWAAAGFQETSANDEGKGQAFVDMLRRRKIGWCYWNWSDGTPGIFATFDSSTTANGPFAPGGPNVTATGRLVHKWLTQPEDPWGRYTGVAIRSAAANGNGGSRSLVFDGRALLIRSRRADASGTVPRQPDGRAVPPHAIRIIPR